MVILGLITVYVHQPNKADLAVIGNHKSASQ
jgi:hypothetical protein